MRKLMAMGLLALVPFATGCAMQHVRFTDVGGNPPFVIADHTYPGDGFQTDDVFRVCFDVEGNIYPDPREHRIDDRRLRSCEHSVAAYFASLNMTYDAASIAKAFARRIEEQRNGRPLVVLIHGINNAYPEARRSYELARLRIRERAVFLDVYWDGLHGDGMTVWGQARPASKWAGLGLRGLLSALDPKTPLRVITHSRGAAVACSALWNVPMREDVATNERYAAKQQRTPPPGAASVRLCLIGPAMPAEDLTACLWGAARPERIVLGVNEDDPVLGKGFLPAHWCGSTALGCTPELFESVRHELSAGGVDSAMVSYAGSEVHDLKDLLMRPAFAEQLALLFGALDSATAAK